MTVDREQTRREKLTDPVRSVECRDPSRCGRNGWRLCEPCGELQDALLAELEQAERERNEFGPLFVRDMCRLLGVDESDYLRLDKAGARLREAVAAEEQLAKVPALVEALRKIANNEYVEAHRILTPYGIAREALAAYEQEQKP